MLLWLFGALPRPAACRAGAAAAWLGHRLARRQRNAGLHNLRMALPELDESARRRIVRETFRNLGRLLVEFSHFPRLTPANIAGLVEYEGFEHYARAAAKGKGVLFLTGHVGAWELCSFAHALNGHPLRFLTRPIDNPWVEALITRYRTGSGNRIISRTRAVREVLAALRQGEAVGILIDQNTTESEGVFVDFFGIPAATTPGLATFALRTRAPVVPGFLRWDPERKRHILRFYPEAPLIESGDRRADVAANTQQFTRILEDFVREFPGEWLWIHRRWKTRPEGEPPLY